MKLFLSKLVWPSALLIVLAFISAPATRAQESEPVVVDEVVAQVNNEVITLSQVKQEIQDAIEAQKQRGVSEQQAREEVMRRQPELIAILITDQLLLQKGKELNYSNDVEEEVNKRIVDVMHENHLNSIEELERALAQLGQSLSGIRQSLRTEIMKQMVLSREVDARLYYGFSTDELHRYYDAHREVFRRNESVALSEIFISLAGRPEGEVRTRAQQLVTQARQPGADFAALAVANSERTDESGQRTAPQNKGKLGTFEIAPGTLNQKIVDALKSVQKGGVTDPIRLDDGYLILHVDDRTPGGDPVFNENHVREAMLQERAPREREAYIQKLRDDAYIKISDTYRAAVEPFLKPSTNRSGAGSTSSNTPGTTNAAGTTNQTPAAATTTTNATTQQQQHQQQQQQQQPTRRP
ncbi:MAG TPA: peptidyl-prolyl cis-trans isomerase [Pyrinomonadaceae bacterium]|nr:peptidyl-prolyl cis-trans isomerase [Pyrinomonadaceae bacterium]